MASLRQLQENHSIEKRLTDFSEAAEAKLF